MIFDGIAHRFSWTNNSARRTKQNILFVLIFVFVLFLLSGCNPSGNYLNDTNDNIKFTTSDISSTIYDFDNAEFVPDTLSTMKIFVFDVGKADAILITTENYTVMIDTGERKHGTEIADYMTDNNITAIDYLIITHFDKDHVGGASEIINRLEVNEVIIPNYGKNSKHYNRFIDAINESETELLYNVLGEITELTLDDSIFTIYPPQQNYFEYGFEDEEGENIDNGGIGDTVTPKENDFSIVISIRHGVLNFLFAGDAMAERINELLSIEDITNIRYDFLKAPHHGRYNKNSLKFLNTVDPRYTVITCSDDNPPDDRIISALNEIGSEVYLSSNGDIYCESNGSDLAVSYFSDK